MITIIIYVWCIALPVRNEHVLSSGVALLQRCKPLPFDRAVTPSPPLLPPLSHDVPGRSPHQYFITFFFGRDSSTQNESGYVGVDGVFFGAIAMTPTPLRTGGDVRGVVCSDSDSGTDAVPAAAPDGVLISAECRLSVTDLYRCGLVLWHRHFNSLKPRYAREQLSDYTNTWYADSVAISGDAYGGGGKAKRWIDLMAENSRRISDVSPRFSQWHKNNLYLVSVSRTSLDIKYWMLIQEQLCNFRCTIIMY